MTEVAQEPVEPEALLTDDVLRQTLDAAPDGIIVADQSGVIVFANPMVEQLFEYPPSELVGRSIEILVPDSVRADHAAHRADYAKHPRTRSMGTGLDLRGRRRSGVEFPLEISLSPLCTRDRLLVISVIRDVTERRAAEHELHRVREALALVDDRERIARDLHDTVIQRLFAVGLSLQGALTRIANEAAFERIQLAVDEIDTTIRDIRSAIFSLHTRRTFAESVRDDVLAVAREAARVLGFEPNVTFDGPVDNAVSAEIRDHLISILREALSNVTKHAHATRVDIEVSIEAGSVCLRVQDNGVGIDDPGGGNGLVNMRERAAALGGEFRIARAAAGSGSQLEWRVPIDASVSG